jgi:hypothetical protein
MIRITAMTPPPMYMSDTSFGERYRRKRANEGSWNSWVMGKQRVDEAVRKCEGISSALPGRHPISRYPSPSNASAERA